MANEQNLLRGNPETQFKSGQEAAEAGRKGGIESGKSKRRAKTFKESLLTILDQNATDAQKEIAKQFITDTSDLTQRDIMNFSMLSEAINNGNVKAAQFVRDTVGEMPTVKQEVTNTMSDGDKALLEKVSKRLEKSTGDGQKDSD